MNSDTKVAPAPSGDGCKECLAMDGWWLHLRRCLACGQIGCCDSSPSQHARGHWQESGHRQIMSYEPGESWYYDWEDNTMIDLPDITITPPLHHPLSQPAPGPAGKVPDDWEYLLN
ncbi:UBP-type zinc finger domain-containing protein [Candidatus Saccharibacteria bacterium]|nr:UBP-type zinc finger domain-containing protein [Candidatus Saccharibacteria bacterium]MCB9835058.1 UBP-type zinc finger domain-containing protein [Candidatus Nomurabacteria bacterium]